MRVSLCPRLKTRAGQGGDALKKPSLSVPCFVAPLRGIGCVPRALLPDEPDLMVGAFAPGLASIAMTQMTRQIVRDQLSVVSCSNAARSLASIAMTQMTQMTQIFDGRRAGFEADRSHAMGIEQACSFLRFIRFS
jgi:hypothetical protein